MAYADPRRRPPPRDRLVAGVGAVLVVAATGAAFVAGLSVDMPKMTQRALAVLDVPVPPPPPPPRIEPEEVVRPRRPAKLAPSPANLRNDPTPVTAPPPIVVPPRRPPVVVAPVSGTGAAPSAGAAAKPGPGYGAGGNGDGRGGGGDGDGDGTAPELVHGRLRFSDLPTEFRHAGFRGRVWVNYHVDRDGRVDDCEVARSDRGPALGALTCRLIAERFRFRPSLDGDGRPVGAWIDESHEWGYDVDDDPDRPAD